MQSTLRQSTSSMTRATPRFTRLAATAALLVVGLALALPVQAKGRGHHGWGGPDGWIEKHAQELGIDDATLGEIQQIVDTSREQANTIYEEHRAARDAMHALLDQDTPDESAVMRQADSIGEIDVRKQKHRLATMLAIRAKLTPEQRTKLRAIKDEMREKHGDRCEHGKRGEQGRHHRGGEGHHGDDSPAPAEAL